MPAHKQAFDACIHDDGTNSENWHSYTIRLERGTEGTGIALFENDDAYIYLGSSVHFDLAAFTLESLYDGNTGIIKWEYASGLNDSVINEWREFVPTYQYDFTYHGAEELSNIDLEEWVKGTINGPMSFADNRTYYWVRASSDTTFGAEVRKVEMRPLAAYCSVKDVSDLLQIKNEFSSATRPSYDAVEQYINAAESYIDHLAWKSWRIGYKHQEEYDFNIAGFKLIERYPRIIGSLEVWDGANWERRREGRRNDFFFVNSTGMLYFSRYFLLPARLHSYNAPVWLWGWAEFNFPVRVSYLYGSNVHSNRREGGIVFDLARKLAAMDVVRNMDNTTLAIVGGDKVSMERKIETWQEETEDRLEALRGWVVF